MRQYERKIGNIWENVKEKSINFSSLLFFTPPLQKKPKKLSYFEQKKKKNLHDFKCIKKGKLKIPLKRRHNCFSN